MIYTASAAESQQFELDDRPVDVVAFGSQLVYGSVGLNAALPMYADAALRCVPVPTVILSNLPHYPSVHAIEVNARWLADTLDGLVAIGALRSARMIAVGYLADPDQAYMIARWYQQLGAHRPPLIVDPTFGDIDVGFYTDPAVAPAIADALVPLASGLTPNLFELAHLGDVEDPATLLHAERSEIIELARSIMGPVTQWVTATGVRGSLADDGRIANVVVTPDRDVVCAHSYRPTKAKGLGDTFAAALIAAILDDQGIISAVDAAGAAVRDRIAPAAPTGSAH